MRFVSAGLAITTAPPIVAAALPPDVLLLPVIDAPAEERRITLLHAGDDPDRAPELLDALREALEMDSASSERRQRGRDEDS